MAEESKKVGFVRYLESLLERDERGALAALRRGVTGPPGAVPDTYPYVIPRLPKGVEADSPRSEPYFLIASLFALYFSGKGKGIVGAGNNIGRAFRMTKLKDASEKGRSPDEEDSTDRRFVALLNADYDDLPNHLRHAISYLKSAEIPLDWHKLFKHICNWNHPDRWVQKELAQGFWGYYQPEKQATVSSNNQ